MKANRRFICAILIIMMICSSAFILSACGGQTQPEECKHTYATKWSRNNVNHWHAATCEHTDRMADIGAHIDDDNNSYCDECDYPLPTNNTPVNAVVNYTVYVKDESGAPVSGISILLVSENGYFTSTKYTDASGKVMFRLEEGDWTAALAESYEQYENSINDRYSFDDSREATITLK